MGTIASDSSNNNKGGYMAELTALLSWVDSVENVTEEASRIITGISDIIAVPWEPVQVTLRCNNAQHCATELGYLYFDSTQWTTIVEIIKDALDSGEHLLSVAPLLYDYAFVSDSEFQKENINWLLFGDCDVCQECDKKHEGCDIEWRIIEEISERYN